MPGVAPPPLDRSAEDNSHLDGLAIAHKVVGIIGMLFACFPLLHLGVGLSIILGFGDLGQELPSQPFPSAMFGAIFAIVGGTMFLLGQALAISTFISGRRIKERRSYTYSFVIGCILCTVFPIGTVLGVLTLIVLSRPSVKALYNR